MSGARRLIHNNFTYYYNYSGGNGDKKLKWNKARLVRCGGGIKLYCVVGAHYQVCCLLVTLPVSTLNCEHQPRYYMQTHIPSMVKLLEVSKVENWMICWQEIVNKYPGDVEMCSPCWCVWCLQGSTYSNSNVTYNTQSLRGPGMQNTARSGYWLCSPDHMWAGSQGRPSSIHLHHVFISFSLIVGFEPHFCGTSSDWGQWSIWWK